jgi:hypothetical protein
MDTTLSVSEWTSITSTFFAAVAAIFSAIAIFLNRKTAKEQRASQAAFQLIDLSLKNKTLSTSKKYEDYEWYVIAVLEVAREILIAYPGDKSRRNQMKVQLSYHRKELSDWMKSDKQDIKDFGPGVFALVEEVLAPPSRIAAE